MRWMIVQMALNKRGSWTISTMPPMHIATDQLFRRASARLAFALPSTSRTNATGQFFPHPMLANKASFRSTAFQGEACSSRCCPVTTGKSLPSHRTSGAMTQLKPYIDATNKRLAFSACTWVACNSDVEAVDHPCVFTLYQLLLFGGFLPTTVPIAAALLQ